MRTYRNRDHAAVLEALGDATRRRVFDVVRDAGPVAVGEIAHSMPVSRPAVSQHLRILEDAGLVRSKKDGTRRLYVVEPNGLLELRLWLDGFWDDALARFTRAAEGSER